MKVPAVLGGVVAIAIAAYSGAWFHYADYYKPYAEKAFAKVEEGSTGHSEDVSVSGFPFSFRYTKQNFSYENTGGTSGEKRQIPELSLGYDILKDTIFVDAPKGIAKQFKGGMKVYAGMNGLRSAMLKKEGEKFLEELRADFENDTTRSKAIFSRFHSYGVTIQAGDTLVEGKKIATLSSPLIVDVKNVWSGGELSFDTIIQGEYKDFDALNFISLAPSASMGNIGSANVIIAKTMIPTSGSLAIKANIKVTPEDKENPFAGNPKAFATDVKEFNFTSDYGTYVLRGAFNYTAAEGDAKAGIVKADLTSKSSWNENYSAALQDAKTEVQNIDAASIQQNEKSALLLYLAAMEYIYAGEGKVDTSVKLDTNITARGSMENMKLNTRMQSDSEAGLAVDVDMHKASGADAGHVNVTCLDCDAGAKWTLGLVKALHTEASTIIPVPFPVVVNEKTTALVQTALRDLSTPIEGEDKNRVVKFLVNGNNLTINGKSPQEYQQKLMGYAMQYMQIVQEPEAAPADAAVQEPAASEEKPTE